ncbi:Acetyltransferase (GNAT) family protein [Seinonella peptonophila]|uniref:Acetyltransferase (GNAT) family protein n=1 Tax=Seinonella peptonophila TaxID=112248 RepID=A0A1M4T7P9_9BACL|nr:GNAT family N-acetyltransferase [Seinonella peptonophila]SHE40414.1 Acetyltransferase (GNAT) family protein [Seinonella peptonophila]
MDNLSIKRLSEVDEQFVEQTAQVFVESYPEMFSLISKDQPTLVRTLMHSFGKDHFYIAMLDNQVLGLIGYSTNKQRAHSFDLNIFKQELGSIKGWICYKLLSSEFQKPLLIEDNQCNFESIATSPSARGKGVATTLIRHLMDNLEFDEAILEVVDNNTNAIRLYEKLGFSIFEKKKQRFSKLAGFNERFYMKIKMR